MFETTFLTKANILNSREEYELELEYIGDEKINGLTKMDIMAKKLKGCHMLLLNYFILMGLYMIHNFHSPT